MKYLIFAALAFALPAVAATVQNATFDDTTGELRLPQLRVVGDSTGSVFSVAMQQLQGLNFRVTETANTSADNSKAFASFDFASGVLLIPKLQLAGESESPVYSVTFRQVQGLDFAVDNVTEIPPVVVTVAGGGGAGRTTAGHADGIGVAATFDSPYGLAIDMAGNVYVADTGNHRVRKIDAMGNVTTLAGGGTVGGVASGHADGQGTAATFSTPTGVAVDASGNVYVADYFNHLIRKIDPRGNVTTLAGGGAVGGIGAGYADGKGSAATFDGPTGVAVDTAGNVYVTDYFNNLIRRVDTTGNVTTLAGGGGLGGNEAGHADGQASAATFDGPTGVAVDVVGNVYVSDYFNNSIRKISPDGRVTTLAGGGSGGGDSGHADGPGSAATFAGPNGLAVDGLGNIYVADTQNYLIRKVDTNGNVSTLPTGDGAAVVLRPNGIAHHGAGNLYSANRENNMIQKFLLSK